MQLGVWRPITLGSLTFQAAASSAMTSSQAAKRSVISVRHWTSSAPPTVRLTESSPARASRATCRAEIPRTSAHASVVISLIRILPQPRLVHAISALQRRILVTDHRLNHAARLPSRTCAQASSKLTHSPAFGRWVAGAISEETGPDEPNSAARRLIMPAGLSP